MGLSSWPPQKGHLSVRVTDLSVGWVKLGREKPLRPSSPNNDPTPPCQPQSSITVPQISSLSGIRLSREGISVMVVSLPHQSSSTYQCWIFTCCFTVNPLLSKSFCNPLLPLSPPQGTQGTQFSCKIWGLLLPSAHDRANDTAKQKAEQQLREQSHLDTPPEPFPRRMAAGFASLFFRNSD